MNFLTLPSEFWPERASFPANSIFVFDFDGVLICQDEEKVFQLEAIEGERSRLEELAFIAGIDAELYDTPYLRHLVFQARYERICKPHVITEFARSLDVPYFVLTLRSGLHAVQRMLAYMDVMHLYPQEVFCVGRGSKATALAKMLDEWPDRQIVFFDDSMRHIKDACSLDHERLTVVHVDWPTCQIEATAMRQEVIIEDRTNHVASVTL